MIELNQPHPSTLQLCRSLKTKHFTTSVTVKTSHVSHCGCWIGLKFTFNPDTQGIASFWPLPERAPTPGCIFISSIKTAESLGHLLNIYGNLTLHITVGRNKSLTRTLKKKTREWGVHRSLSKHVFLIISDIPQNLMCLSICNHVEDYARAQKWEGSEAFSKQEVKAKEELETALLEFEVLPQHTQSLWANTVRLIDPRYVRTALCSHYLTTDKTGQRLQLPCILNNMDIKEDISNKSNK